MRDLPELMLAYGIELKKRGNRFEALCFNHEETTPSLSIFRGNDGKWRYYCFVCLDKCKGDAYSLVQHFDNCGFKDAQKIVEGESNQVINGQYKRIKEELLTSGAWHSHPGVGQPESFAIKNLGDPTGKWGYKGSKGETLGFVCRYITPEGTKTYRPWTYGRYGEVAAPLEWRALTWAKPRPLYGLDRLAAKPDAKVLIVEGEKTADAAQELFSGMVCMTWPGGAGAGWHVDWTPLTGKHIILCPDSDAAGMAGMETVAGFLLAINCTVQLIDSSDMPKGWDLADAEGWTGDQAVTWARERLKSVISGEIKAKKEKEHAEAMEKKTEADALEVLEQPIDAAEPIARIELPPDPQKPPEKAVRAKDVQIQEYLPPEFSQDALAMAWSDAVGPNYKFVNAWNKWLLWDGVRWKIDDTQRTFYECLTMMREIVHWPGSSNLSAAQKRDICSRGRIREVLGIAGSYPQHAMRADQFDADPWLLGTPEGVVDLRLGKLIEATPDMLITKITAVAPKRGPMPYWDMVLSRCTNGDETMKQYYQSWAGYILTGDCREEAFLFVHGEGNSGKSKFIDCLGDMMGEYCATAKIEMLMESRIERHSSEIAALAGARMVRASEPEEGSRWNEALLKLITGRDTIAARRLYEEQFTFRPQFKLVIGGNFRPALKSTGEEIRRRMHFANFPGAVPVNQRIYDLPEKLRAEWPAIMQWAIDGCINWQECGLGKPEAIEEATKDYLDEEDTLASWLAEKCEKCNDRVQTSEAYKSYVAYIMSVGEKPTSQKRFSGRMEARGFGKARTSEGRFIVGLRIKHSFPSGGRYDD